MSSPPQFTFSAFPALTSSPMKGFNYYFQDGSDGEQHHHDFHFQDENMAPMDASVSMHPHFAGAGLQMGHDEVVPASQHSSNPGAPLAPVDQNQSQHAFQNLQSQMLQMAPKFEMMPPPAQQHVQHQHVQHHQIQVIHQQPQPQQQQQQQQHQDSGEQKNLYPAMHVFQHQSSITQSASTNTLASFESAPGLTISHSASDNSLAMSPMSFQNMNQTPHRVAHRRLSNAITPLPQVFESPTGQVSPVATRSQSHSSLVTPSTSAKILRHRRTRSRLSLDLAAGTSGLNRSPSGTNPFYTAFMSPAQQRASPQATPLQTPHRSAVSPTMLMNTSSALTPMFKEERDENEGLPPKAVFAAAADFTMKMASQRLEETERHPELARSHSSIDLASIAGIKSPPPEVTRFDIMTPRRKRNSKVYDDEYLKQKKSHICPLCGSGFQRPEHVKRHMRAHSSEKPFQCDEPGCGKRFNRADNMKAHLRKIHGKDV